MLRDAWSTLYDIDSEEAPDLGVLCRVHFRGGGGVVLKENQKETNRLEMSPILRKLGPPTPLG